MCKDSMASDSLTVECSWAHNSNEELRRVFQLTEDDAGTLDLDIDSLTSLETCMCLLRGNSTGPPELTITTQRAVNRIDIVSEAKLVEVFQGGGDVSEYLATVRSEFVDDWEGMAVYYTKILIPDTAAGHTFTLKCSRMRDPDRLWMYGARIQVGVSKPTRSSIPSSSNLPQDSVQVPPEVLAFAKKLEQLSVKRQPEENPTKCLDCENRSQALEAVEQRLNLRLTKMEENVITAIKEQNEQLLKDMKCLLVSANVLNNN